nr:MAG TPA: hypothetical protein [Bacteriophage sp.]
MAPHRDRRTSWSKFRFQLIRLSLWDWLHELYFINQLINFVIFSF